MTAYSIQTGKKVGEVVGVEPLGREPHVYPDNFAVRVRTDAGIVYVAASKVEVKP